MKFMSEFGYWVWKEIANKFFDKKKIIIPAMWNCGRHQHRGTQRLIRQSIMGPKPF